MENLVSLSKTEGYQKLNKITKGIINGKYFLGAKLYYSEIIYNFINTIEKNSIILIIGEECRNTALVIESAVKSIKEQQQIINEEF